MSVAVQCLLSVGERFSTLSQHYLNPLSTFSQHNLNIISTLSQHSLGPLSTEELRNAH